MEKSSNKLVDLSVAFAIEILNLVKYLKTQHETIICIYFRRQGFPCAPIIQNGQIVFCVPEDRQNENNLIVNSLWIVFYIEWCQLFKTLHAVG